MEATYLKRLAFIKYLFSVGLYQSHQPMPLCGICILSFHDSVELFLQLSLEKLNTSKKDISFMTYWDRIDEKLKGTTLSQKESMKRLNKARVNLKHYGIIPSELDIESFRATTAAFFYDNCPVIFDIDFNDVSLIDIIKYERPRNQLIEAKNNFEKKLIDKALINIILSFDYLISDYEESKRDKVHGSPFFFGEDMRSLGRFRFNLGSFDYKENRGIERFADKISGEFEKVAKSIEQIQDAIKILSFGIDYKKYVKFRSITQSISVAFTSRGGLRSYTHSEPTLTKEELDFCINFIVESALKLQEFDFELKEQ